MGQSSAGDVRIGSSTGNLQQLSEKVEELQNSSNTSVYLGVNTKYQHSSVTGSNLSEMMAEYRLTGEWLRDKELLMEGTEKEKTDQTPERFPDLKTESNLQEYLNTQYEAMKLIDTHDRPLRSFNQDKIGTDEVLLANGKPDAISQMRGGASWEVKGPNEVCFSFFLCSFFAPPCLKKALRLQVFFFRCSRGWCPL